MRYAFFVIGICALLSPPAHASMAEAREVARISNCMPKKIEVYSQSLGDAAPTTYRVECAMPKVKDESAASGPNAVLVECKASLCSLVRTLAEKKE